MKRSLTFAIVLAGCFGSGPVPPVASDAPIVFAAPIPSTADACTASTYITSLAFGSDHGYAVLYPYGPENSDDNCSSNVPTASVDVMEFPIDGSLVAGTMVGNAGMSAQNTPPPELAIGSAGPLWAFDMASQPPVTVVAAPGTNQLALPQGSGNSLGYLAGAAGDFVATANGFSPVDPMDPNYPCCTQNAAQATPGDLTPVSVSGAQITAAAPESVTGIVLGELASTIAVDDQTAFYVEAKQAPAMGFGIEAVDATSSTEIATVATGLLPTGTVPVGLVADNAHVAWAFAQDAEATPLASGCAIWALPVDSGSGSAVAPLFSSTNLSCMGLALDPDAVYFAIVEEVTQSGCSGCTPELHGLGIGRVDFAMHTFSSIAFDISEPDSGPRRVFASPSDPNDLFVLDPLVVAKIAKTAFGGRQDISP